MTAIEPPKDNLIPIFFKIVTSGREEFENWKWKFNHNDYTKNISKSKALMIFFHEIVCVCVCVSVLESKETK